MPRFRALFSALTVALCALLALSLATDTAVAQPVESARKAGTPYATAETRAENVTARPGPAPGIHVEQDRQPAPYDDCRHRRAIRASVAVATPHLVPCALCALHAPTTHPVHTPRPAVRTLTAVTPEPGERTALLQVFRC